MGNEGIPEVVTRYLNAYGEEETFRRKSKIAKALHESLVPEVTAAVAAAPNHEVHAELLGDAVVLGVELTMRSPEHLDSIKEELFKIQGGRCAGDGQAFALRNLTLDHILPQSKGGTDKADNLQLLCASCNAIKGDRDMDYLRMRLAQMDSGAK